MDILSNELLALKMRILHLDGRVKLSLMENCIIVMVGLLKVYVQSQSENLKGLCSICMASGLFVLHMWQRRTY